MLSNQCFFSGSNHQDDRPIDRHQGGHQLQHDQRPEVCGADQTLQEKISGDAKTHLRAKAISASKRSQRGET